MRAAHLHIETHKTRKRRYCMNDDCGCILGIGQPYTRIVWLGGAIPFEARDLCTSCGSDVESFPGLPWVYDSVDDYLDAAFNRADEDRKLDAAIERAERRNDERREEGWR